MIVGEWGEALTERRKGAGVGAGTSQPLGLGFGNLWGRDFGQEFWQGYIHGMQTSHDSHVTTEKLTCDSHVTIE